MGWIVAGVFFGLFCGAISAAIRAQEMIIELRQQNNRLIDENKSLIVTALESKSVQYVDPGVTAERLKAISEARERKKRIATRIAELELEHRIPKPEESEAG